MIWKRYNVFKNLKNFHSFLLILIFLIVIEGCIEEINKQEKFQPPEWLEGKIFSQIQNEDDLITFISCLEKTGYDTILNTSGSFTVFAPTDEAFKHFFDEHPNYKILLESNEPSPELNKLIEYQILYNAWTKEQFQTMDIGGWIDPTDELKKPRAYKRMTLYREENNSYPVKLIEGNNYQITDSSESNTFIKSYSQSNKFCPIFYGEYLSINNLNGSDYDFYFNRPFNSGKLYFAGAEFEDEIPAENGFIYKTDKVITPLPSGESILKKGSENHSYNKILNLIQQFSEFSFNQQATNEQPGAEEGLEVDELYNLEYPDLVFNISNELTGNTNNQRFTYREHHGLMVPTDLALESFISEHLPRFDNYNKLPTRLKRIVVNSHMSNKAIYPTDIKNGILNGEMDRVFLNEDDIIQKTYGSNCSFLGLKNAVVPRVLTSICRPLYLLNDFEIMMYASERTNVLSALKKIDVNYAFYLPGDQGIGEAGDSSLIRVVTNPELNRYHFEALNRRDEKMERIGTEYLRNKILNQITISTPDGIANKEFLRTLGGKYIVVNNETENVSGSGRTRFGYYGDSTITLTLKRIHEEMDNGEVFEVNGWFSFSGTSYYGLFSSKYPKFLELLTKAGLYDPIYYDFPFLVDGEYYTVFIPTEKALNDYGVDDLSKEELRKLLKFHFIRGDLIFTDGKKPEGKYSTKLERDNSYSYSAKFYELNIRPEPNAIKILDKNGDIFYSVVEREGETNQIIWHDSNENSDSEWDFITTGIVHNIDKVLIGDSLRVD